MHLEAKHNKSNCAFWKKQKNWALPYLHCDVQGIHDLPNHKGQDVNNQQDSYGGIELPGLQVLLGYKKTSESTLHPGQ